MVLAASLAFVGGCAAPNPGPPGPGPAPGTVGAVSGGGNILSADATSYRIGDLTTLHAGVGRLSLNPDSDYFANGAPSPANVDAVVVAMLRGNVRPYVLFEFESSFDSADLGKPERNSDDWFSIGSAFAERFGPGSTFLKNQGIADQGVVEWSAINEVDRQGKEDPALTYAQYHDMLKGLADGVHHSDPAGKVYPAGYLGANRDQDYTAWGYLPAIAPLINDGTLAGFDLHTYSDKSFAPLFNTHERSFQRDFERCIEQSGITRVDIDWVTTEHNVKADPDASSQGYDESTARRWFLTQFFDVQGAVRSDGSPASGVRLAWNLWRQGPESFFMTTLDTPRVTRWCGVTHKLLLDLLHDMSFVQNDPTATGTFKLTGSGKTAWVFQNIHPSWSSQFGDTFTISDIPANATRVDVYDGNGLITTVTNPKTPAHTFATPTGVSYLFIADAQ